MTENRVKQQLNKLKAEQKAKSKKRKSKIKSGKRSSKQIEHYWFPSGE